MLMRILVALAFLICFADSRISESSLLRRLSDSSSIKHRAFCPGAGARRSWCKTKAFFVRNAAEKQNAQSLCEQRYNFDLRSCQNTKMMRRMEVRILSGQEKHRSWCTFKAKNKWTWCKLGAKLTWNSQKRGENNNTCDFNYNQSLSSCNVAAANKHRGGAESASAAL